MLMIDVGRYKNGDKGQTAGSNFITIENKMEKHSIKYKLNEECGEQETRDKCILLQKVLDGLVQLSQENSRVRKCFNDIKIELQSRSRQIYLGQRAQRPDDS